MASDTLGVCERLAVRIFEQLGEWATLPSAQPRRQPIFFERRPKWYNNGERYDRCYFCRNTGCPLHSFFGRSTSAYHGRYSARSLKRLSWQDMSTALDLPTDLAIFRTLPLLCLTVTYSPQSAWESTNTTHDFVYLSTPGPGSTFRSIRPLVDFGWIKEWLATCQAQHLETCNSLERRLDIPGLQMIDCSTRAIVQYGALQQSPGYITLSYVWGESSSEGRRFRNRVPRVVPKVINDAIQVVLSLGYRYLWVDRYCIPESHADKHAQLRKMGDIYQNSDLTIIAAAGEGPHHGLPGASATPRRELRPYEFLSGSQPWALYQLPTNLKRVIRDSNWYKRGWTYQEALLCRRQLVFTKDQVYLQCKKTHCMEILCPTLASDHPGIEALGPTAEISSRFAVGRVFHPMTRQLACTEFPTMVNEYARRKLTYEDDILDAFEGILHRFELLARPLENLYGIPLYPIDQSELTDTDALVYGLLWNHAAADMLMGPDMMKGIVRRGAKREFPSWSWTGWKRVFGGGGLEYHFHLWPLSEILSDTGLSLGKNRFKALVEVHAAGLGGNDDPVMPWETQRENILRLIRGGEGTPRIVSLNLLGWVLTFDVAVSKYSSGRGTEMVKLGPFKVHREELAISCCMAAGSGLLPTTKLRCIVVGQLSLWSTQRAEYNTWLYVMTFGKEDGSDDGLCTRYGVMRLEIGGVGHGVDVWDEINCCPSGLLAGLCCERKEIRLR